MLKRQFQERFEGKRVAVIGIGISNRPLIEMLVQAGAAVTAYDKKTREALGDTYTELCARGVKLSLGEGYLDSLDAEIVFRTPGMRYDHPALMRAKEKGAEITSEMQVFFELCPATIIGITGSDGKTTTTTLICRLLEAQGKTVYLGGNIGKPRLPRLFMMTREDFCVVELSSFQLHTMTVSPHIAVITNLSPNHLDYHKTETEYIEAKYNIFLHQTAGDVLVVNGENKSHLDRALHHFLNRMRTEQKLPSKERFFNGADVYEKDGEIYCEGKWVMSVADIRIPGRHNVENYMAAIAATKGIVSFETVRALAKSFGGVEHRIEFVRCVKGVSYYNSSIDSSPTRTIAALRAFGGKKLTVLLGGYDKNLDYAPLAEPLCQFAKTVILCGATAEKIKNALVSSTMYHKDAPKIVMTGDYGESVAYAYRHSEEGDTVLLSPASASFDAFVNFEERGRYFKSLVMALPDLESQ
ncbi:MAG: UDP-N-acetylmuramoyl-L-alanine--D-glutamate ligase [Clostridia bacterium]|nr:UDP-N-acetylmuramoyl-L-alanine--D-glutamate ligase [Clostridia bacterium]